MAFSIRLECKDSVDKTLWKIDHLFWWPQRELMRDPRFEKRVSDGYLDYVAQLSVEEARALEEENRDDGESSAPPKANELFEKLATADSKSQSVVVTIYEWESGL